MKQLLVSMILIGYSLFVNAEIVTVPIPGAPGLSVTVGTGVNALPLQNIQNNPNATNITMGDDEMRNVPLGFNFPYWGKTFNNSWMSSNGLVTFQDPANNGIPWAGCCSGINLSTSTDTRYNYSIFGVHSDLYAAPGVGSNWYLKETNAMTYGWYNVSQCCNSNGGNSFEIKINSSGGVDTRIAGAFVQWNAVTSGMSGDLSKGEYYQYYHGQGINIPYGTGVSWQALQGTGIDQCTVNPLSSPSCPNYFTAQCTISPLYNPSCPGYAQAYYTQQCAANPLYDINCPGYASAYLTYQCSLDPLYSTTCEGYEQAYFDKQCKENGLYSNKCPNYATAYATWLALNTSTSTSTTTTTNTNNTTATSTPTTESTGELKIAVVSDPVVNNVITTTATSASPAQSATATVPLVQTTTTSTPVAVAVERKQEEKNASSTSVSSTSTAQNTTTETKTDAKPTARQELQAKREAAAKAKAVEEGKNLAANIGKAVDMEQQKMVQNVVIQAMGFTPGFDAYQKVIVPDGVGYKPFTVYANQKTVDNRKLGMGLYGPSDRLHNELIESQYSRGN